MEYMLMIYSDPNGFDKLSPSQQAEGMAAYGAYHEALKKAGVLKNSNRLRPAASATTVRLQSGKTHFLIDVPDLDAALSWAARCPGAAHGIVEVRPVWAM